MLAGIAGCVFEASWERRALGESALLREWRARAPAEADGFHREHFRAEIAMSRDAVWGTLPALAAVDLLLGGRSWPLALGLVLLPVSKLAWQADFNAVEAAVPPFSSLVRLREEEVRQGLQGDAAGARACRRQRRMLGHRLLGALSLGAAVLLCLHLFRDI